MILTPRGEQDSAYRSAPRLFPPPGFGMSSPEGVVRGFVAIRHSTLDLRARRPPMSNVECRVSNHIDAEIDPSRQVRAEGTASRATIRAAYAHEAPRPSSPR